MRLGANLLLKDGKVWQSYGWDLLRPLGSLQVAVDSLDEYHCDEISIIRPIRKIDSEESLDADINALNKLKTSTPISFGGGLRALNQLNRINDIPIERLIFSSAFIEKNKKLLDQALNKFGRQAIQCLLPFVEKDGKYFIYFPKKEKYIDLSMFDFEFIDANANEIILYDCRNEGSNSIFDLKFIENIPICHRRLIISGGSLPLLLSGFKNLEFASILVENKVLHKEYSVREMKKIYGM
tara:strand:+ start:1446 stop:2162 length:717 start_codon:yes stop_codon:yes gene_type:complete